MICVTIAQESRRLALADILNAVMLGADMIEVRLDKFERDAKLGDLVAAKRKPLLFSCKRPQDGGSWQGTEAERITLLRTAVIAKADYVEIELDAADELRPFRGYKRVVSYTNLTETPKDIADIYARMEAKSPDIIKLTCKARTPEEAWPLILILNKATIPTVVVGLGRAGVMLSLLGRKIGAPWATAAMEKGMEAFPGQPTIQDLVDVFRYRDVGKKTRFVGVTGLGEREYAAAGLLNVAFAHLGMHHRALPLQVGSLKMFRKIADLVRLQGVVLDADHVTGLHEIAHYDPSARAPVLAANTLLPSADGWSAANAFGDAAANAITATLRDRGDEPLQRRSVLITGGGPQARMLAGPLKARGASLIWAGKNKEASQALSQTFGGRHIAWEAIYATGHDILVLAQDDSSEAAGDEMPLRPGYLRPGMAVLDLAGGMQLTPFQLEAKTRGCVAVSPHRLLVEEVLEHVRKLGGGDVPVELLDEKLATWIPLEEEDFAGKENWIPG